MITALITVTAVGISISRRTIFSMLASVLAMLCNLLGNYLLVPKYGAAGAATSTLLSFVLFYVLRTEFSKYVWRNIATRKTYLVLSLLSIHVLINLWVLKDSLSVVIISLVLLFLGVVMFPTTIQASRKTLQGFMSKIWL